MYERPLVILIYDFATAPFWISEENFVYFLSVNTLHIQNIRNSTIDEEFTTCSNYLLLCIWCRERILERAHAFLLSS
jgi:hypothetical protein